MEPSPPALVGTKRSRWLASLLIVLFLGFHVAIIVRSATLLDDRWGWRMFHHVIFYRLKYQWVRDDRVVNFNPPKLTLAARSRIRDRHWHRTVFGLGFVRSMASSYLAWVWENHRPDEEVTGVRCVLIYRENDQSKKYREILEYSPGSEQE